MNEKSPLLKANDLAPEGLPIIPQARLDAFLADSPEEAEQRATRWAELANSAEMAKRRLFGSFEDVILAMWADRCEPTPEQAAAARARADARDLADIALRARLDAAPTVWCIQEDHGYEGGVQVLAIFPTEEAANAALPLFEHKGDVEVESLPYFPA